MQSGCISDFPLSLRLVEEMLLERGVIVSYDTIRCWAKKFGPEYAEASLEASYTRSCVFNRGTDRPFSRWPHGNGFFYCQPVPAWPSAFQEARR